MQAANRWRVEGTLTEFELVGDEGGPIPTLRELSGDRVAAVYERVAPSGTDEARCQEYAGDYRSLELNTRYCVRMSTVGLTLRRHGIAAELLRPTIVDGFYTPDGTHLTFVQDRDGQVRGFTLSTARVRRLCFEKVMQEGNNAHSPAHV